MIIKKNYLKNKGDEMGFIDQEERITVSELKETNYQLQKLNDKFEKLIKVLVQIKDVKES